MPCYKPLTAYKSLMEKTDNGKSVIIFNEIEAKQKPCEKVTLPCGQCIGCRLARSRDWAIRCVHESSLYSDNCFITLTFNDENLNKNGSLVKSDFQKFMKRLRKKYNGKDSITNDKGQTIYPIRFFHCGEYGSMLERPHHHACLFNFDFDDKELIKVRDGVNLYRSEKLEQLWSKKIDPYDYLDYKPETLWENRNGDLMVKLGYCTLGDVTFESAAYCARYITKKINGVYALEHYLKSWNEDTGEAVILEPEYITMSRRPGIGRGWYEHYNSDLYPKDYVTNLGKKFKVPKYYDNLYEKFSPDDYLSIKSKRKLAFDVHSDNNTSERLAVREYCQQRKLNELYRSYENAETDVFNL